MSAYNPRGGGLGLAGAGTSSSLCPAPSALLAGLDVLYRENTFTHVRIKVEEAASSPPSRLTLY